MNLVEIGKNGPNFRFKWKKYRCIKVYPRGQIVFVLLINDLPQGIDIDTNSALYGDGTKIWRKITCDNDLATIQKDINCLLTLNILHSLCCHSFYTITYLEKIFFLMLILKVI